MPKLIVAALAFFVAGVALAQAPAAAPAKAEAKPAAAAPAPAAAPAAAPVAANDCEAKAVGKNGKPLAGAAKTAFMKKCQGDQGAGANACEAQAAEKKLAGAAKNSFLKKCHADAKGGK